MKLRHALALGAAVLTVAPVSDCAGEAHAQPVGPCGGHGNTLTVPVGGRALCQNTGKPLQDGGEWDATVIVNSDGGWSVNFNRSLPSDVATFLEVEIHFGESGSGGPGPNNGVFTGVLPAGDSSTQMAGSVNLLEFAPFGCHAQVDVKAVNGDKDTPTNRVRIAGPHFQFAPELCQPSPVTTAPSTSPTTAPGTSPTTATVSSTVPGSTVPGATIPATGGNAGVGWMIGRVALVLVGFFLIVVGAGRRRLDV
jgi:hypothetical protein